MERLVTDFPLPDSPTSASVEPVANLKAHVICCFDCAGAGKKVGAEMLDFENVVGHLIRRQFLVGPDWSVWIAVAFVNILRVEGDAIIDIGLAKLAAY